VIDEKLKSSKNKHYSFQQNRFMHTSPDFKMLQMESFNSLNNPETSNIKSETIKFSYLKISPFLDILFEPEYDIHSLFHVNTRDITERFWWRKTGVLLQLIYGTFTWQPIRNSYVALSNLKAVHLGEGRKHISDNTVIFGHKINFRTHSTMH